MRLRKQEVEMKRRPIVIALVHRHVRSTTDIQDGDLK